MYVMDAEILVIDDAKVERFFEMRLLEKLGAKADEAESVKQALPMLQKNEYKLVLLDQKMPGEPDGWEIIGEMRRQGFLMPVVLFGEKNENTQTDDIIVLKKPAEYRRLTEVLQKYLMMPLSKKETAAPPVGELDTAQGVRNCGSEEGYREALEIYYRTIPDKADEIEGFYKDGDIDAYTIKVHALKSSSLIVGATALSELARELEQAGKDGDTKKIEAETERLLLSYRHYREVLAPMFADASEEEKPHVPEEVLADAYASVAEFAEQMDVDMIEMVLESMKEYHLQPEDEKTMRDISDCLLALDWEKMTTLVRQKI